MSEPKLEISESTITKIGGMLTTLAPIGLAVLQYVNDPDNIVGILVCIVLMVTLVLWRQTQQNVRELKADVAILREALKVERDVMTKYKEVSVTTIMNMFGWLQRLAGARDAGYIALDKETGATIYYPPKESVPENGDRRAR